MPLTPNQRRTYDQLKTLFGIKDPRRECYQVITMRSDCCSGKDYVCGKFLRRMQRGGALVRHFDLCDLCKGLDHRISGQDVAAYLDVLSQPSDGEIYVYIRRIDTINEVLCEYGMEVRHLFPLILTRWVQRLPLNVKVLISSNNQVHMRIENTAFWVVDMKLTAEDAQYILDRSADLSSEVKSQIMKISKVPMPGHIFEGLRYARCMSGTANKDKILGANALFDYYKEGYMKASGMTLETQKDIPKPVPEEDLIGLEELMERIRVGILNPIEMNHPEVPMVRGIILAGEKGTGKSSLGRWLAHKLGGKLYLIGGETGVRGATFISNFEDTIKEAAKNSPAVVFVDDVDTLFGNDDTYRAFLTILDGLDSEKRSNVCVIATCMSLATVPSSLIRGGRLEMCLFTRLPGLESIQRVLMNGFEKIKRVGVSMSSGNSNETVTVIELSLNVETARWIATRMLGFNYADIRRCSDDVLRSLLATPSRNLEDQSIRDLFEKNIQQIKQQYEHCAKTEATDVDKTSYLTIYN